MKVNTSLFLFLIITLPVVSEGAWQDVVTWESGEGWQTVEVSRTYDHGGGWIWIEQAGVWAFIVDPKAIDPFESLIPAGTFTMGSPTSEPGRDSDETQHTVILTRSFYLQTTEVTKAQWDAVAAEGPSRGYTDLPPGGNGRNGDASLTHPVTEVSWYEVVKWLNLKSELEGLTPCYTVSGSTYKTGESDAVSCNFDASGYRLPTESEWEYACRAGTSTAFYSGPITYTDCTLDPNLDEIAWYCGNSGSNTHPVGGKQANAWGLYDMSGNVWEWCWDWYGTYYPGTVTDPMGPSSGANRVGRGGNFSRHAQFCRSAFRSFNFPGNRINFFGFRPARSSGG